ncbi:MAG: hypothetical protein IJB19_07160 [Clostridia bacterium]|nr:hypothetical protein [Clostridia bacterium]
MEQERFFNFTRLIDGIHKDVLKIRLDYAPAFGVKSVHVFWLYDLLSHPEGLSATELAASSQIDRSLISREIAALKKQGLIQSENVEGKRNYNAKLTLTESGKAAAKRISELGVYFQNRVSEDIDEKKLMIFYDALEKMYRNLEKIAAEGFDASIQKISPETIERNSHEESTAE